MKQLLMATDLSARSHRALERALEIARERGADLMIVHVVDKDLPASLADAQRKAAEEAIREKVENLAAGDASNISIEVVFGRPHVDILELSEKVEAELIVLGVHRQDLFKDMFRGATVERIMRAGNTPVLLVRDPIRGSYQHVMVGVDFSVYSRRAVEFAAQFVPGGEFHLVHAYEVPFKGFLYGRETKSQVSKEHQLQFEKMLDGELAVFLATLGTKPHKIEPIIKEGPVQEVIYREIARLKPDLLVIGTHGRTGVAHAFFGSVAEALLSAPPCDVLAVKAW